MHEIVPGRLWLGNAVESRDLRHILDLGIEAIVDLAVQELPLPVTRELIYLRIPLVDGADNELVRLSCAVEVVVRLIERATPTLVFCSAGMSRSPAIIAAALSMVRNQPPEQVLEQIAASIPHDVSPRLWQDVLQVLQRPGR
jgi:hypothetical protein